MQIIHTVSELRAILKPKRAQGLEIGFVPTMGALHQGHGSLVKRSVEQNSITVVSVFVNPTQFRPGEDLDKYPKTLAADVRMVEEIGADIVFAPSAGEVYPFKKNEFFFQIRSLDDFFCGAARKGHFNGVVQVVTMLFNMVQPDRAYFGLKDFQQFSILSRMTREFHFPIEIVGCPIVREPDGLAMSSRNVYLDPEERKDALFLQKTLLEVRKMARSGSSKTDLVDYVNQAEKKYTKIKLDYFDICDSETLRPVEEINPKQRPVALIAAYCGATRLIDNLFLFDS